MNARDISMLFDKVKWIYFWVKLPHFSTGSCWIAFIFGIHITWCTWCTCCSTSLTEVAASRCACGAIFFSVVIPLCLGSIEKNYYTAVLIVQTHIENDPSTGTHCHFPYWWWSHYVSITAPYVNNCDWIYKNQTYLCIFKIPFYCIFIINLLKCMSRHSFSFIFNELLKLQSYKVTVAEDWFIQ